MAEVRAANRQFTILDPKEANTESDPVGPEPVAISQDASAAQKDWDLVSDMS